MDSLAAFPPLADPELHRLRPGLLSAGPRVRPRRSISTGASAARSTRSAGAALATGGACGRAGGRDPLPRQAQPFRRAGSARDRGRRAGRLRDGWLNRALGVMPGATEATALSVGRDGMLLMRGRGAGSRLVARRELRAGRATARLIERLYRADPLFAEAAATAEALGGRGYGALGRRVGRAGPLRRRRLAGEVRIAAFSIGGWDTHRAQVGRSSAPLEAACRRGHGVAGALGPAWGRPGDRDHGIRPDGPRRTAAAAPITAPAARRCSPAACCGAAGCFGEWPGLATGRSTRTAISCRRATCGSIPALALADLFGVDRTRIERDIFPGLDIGAGQKFLA